MPHPHHKKKSSHRPRHGSSSQTAHHAGSRSVRELRDKRRETSVDRRLQELAMRPGDRRAIERKVWEKKSFWDEEVEYMGQVEMQEARKESGGSREHSTSKCCGVTGSDTLQKIVVRRRAGVTNAMSLGTMPRIAARTMCAWSATGRGTWPKIAQMVTKRLATAAQEKDTLPWIAQAVRERETRSGRETSVVKPV